MRVRPTPGPPPVLLPVPPFNPRSAHRRVLPPRVSLFKYTHYTFIRALNTSRIDGIERCIQGIYTRISLILPRDPVRRVASRLIPSAIRYSLPCPRPRLISTPRALQSQPAAWPAVPPYIRFCVGRAMLDWCRCVCKRAGQHQCFESSVRPHYFTPGLGTAIPHRLACCSPYITTAPLAPRVVRPGISSPPASTLLPSPPPPPQSCSRSLAPLLAGARGSRCTRPILIDMGFRLPLTTYVT